MISKDEFIPKGTLVGWLIQAALTYLWLIEDQQWAYGLIGVYLVLVTFTCVWGTYQLFKTRGKWCEPFTYPLWMNLLGLGIDVAFIGMTIRGGYPLTALWWGCGVAYGWFLHRLHRRLLS